MDLISARSARYSRPPLSRCPRPLSLGRWDSLLGPNFVRDERENLIQLDLFIKLIRDLDDGTEELDFARLPRANGMLFHHHRTPGHLAVTESVALPPEFTVSVVPRRSSPPDCPKCG